MNKLRQTWTALSSSLWFVPALLALSGVALALVLVEADARVSRETLLEWPRLFGGGAGGAREVLSAIAGSTVTVVGVTFSITVVALSLASSQYTSRVLRNFMKDRANQFALGVFSGLFAYCLVVLRTIRDTDEGRFVPALAVLCGVLLALFGVGVLIYFLHHIASSIQAASLVAAVYADTIRSVDHLFPEELGDEPEEEDVAAARAISGAAWRAVPARETGYVQSVDEEALLAFARERGAVVRMERGVGEFVVEGAALASVTGGGRPDERDGAALNDAHTLSRFRTVEQDAAFGVRQIVDIALKALSPGVNDTTTAVVCVDYLSAVLARVARRRVAAPYRYEGGELRVVARGPTFRSLVAGAFDQVRQNAAGNPAVLVRMLGGLEAVAAFTRSEARRAVLREQVELIAAQAERTIESGHDLTAVMGRAAAAREALGEGAGAAALAVGGG